METAKEGEYTAIRDCYYSDGVFRHKYFKAGEKLLEGWIPDANGCTHFAKTMDAKKLIRQGSTNNRAVTAGDDKRSTNEIRAILATFMKTVPQSWKRKKLWTELIKREVAGAKDALTNPKEK